MKVALFGGTFDPVHRGHLAVAHAAAKKFDLRRIYFVPATLPPHKGNQILTDFHHRFAMLALATAQDESFVPSLMEAGSTRPNYSIQTVQRMKSTLQPSDKLYFLIGIDAFKDISVWKQPAQLLAECDFIVVSRPGHSLDEIEKALPEGLRPPAGPRQTSPRRQAGETISLPSATIHLLSGVQEAISSTRIRAAAGKSVRQLSRYVPEEVARYIKKQGLYTSATNPQEKSGAGDDKVLSFRRVRHQES